MFKEEVIKDKALEYIEKMCLVYENSNKYDQRNVQIIIDTIYRHAHCVRTDIECFDAHEEWREELIKRDWEI